MAEEPSEPPAPTTDDGASISQESWFDALDETVHAATLGIDRADNEVRDFFKSMFRSEEGTVQGLVDEAFLYTMEDVYEFGSYSYELHRKLLGSAQCRMYMDVIIGIVLVVRYLCDTLKVPMDCSLNA